MSDASTLMARCDLLATVTEEPGGITRQYGSESMRRVNELVSGWMRDAGMTVRTDAIGNVIGRYAGDSGATMVLGSHLDTVRDAGRYDGILGVLAALACVERLHGRGERPPFSVELAAFADEEGLRFGTAYLGSSVYAGAFDPSWLELHDAGGETVADAVRGFGGDPDALRSEARTGPEPAGLLGYCEVHIEQGPVLEREGLPVGVVSAIAGQSRIGVEFTGEAGHAGTVPMPGRKDALCAAAEFVSAVEEEARAEPGAVATVGELAVSPGASNVVPGGARLSLDVRHQDDRVRERLCAGLEEVASRIARDRGVECAWRLRQQSPAVPMSEEITGALFRAVEEQGFAARQLQSGAGHDAAQMSTFTPSAMLFVRCAGGVSHSPDESVTEADAGVAIETLYRFLRLMEREPGVGGRRANGDCSPRQDAT